MFAFNGKTSQQQEIFETKEIVLQFTIYLFQKVLHMFCLLENTLNNTTIFKSNALNPPGGKMREKKTSRNKRKISTKTFEQHLKKFFYSKLQENQPVSRLQHLENKGYLPQELCAHLSYHPYRRPTLVRPTYNLAVTNVNDKHGKQTKMSPPPSKRTLRFFVGGGGASRQYTQIWNNVRF